VAMALRRWHNTPFRYTASRVPAAGPVNGAGIPEPGPAKARSAKRVMHQESQPDRQLRLLY